jgi:hypothetical protein
MHAFRPAVSHFLVEGAARKVEPGLIEKVAELVRSRHPDEDRRRIGDGAETGLALPQTILGHFALGDVNDDAQNPVHFSSGIAMTTAPAGNPANLTVRLQEAIFNLVIRPVRERLLQRMGPQFAVVGMGGTDKQGLGHRHIRWKTKQCLRFSGNPYCIAVNVQAPQPHTGRCQSQAHPRFGFDRLQFAAQFVFI